jgi:stage V sporulation protein B
MDSVCDGLLKGLDQQFSIFRNSILDSLGRLALIMFLLPKYGLYGFVGIMYVSNLFTCSMNLFRLKKISKARLPWFMWLILPGVAAICFGTIIYLLLDIFALPNLPFTIIYSLLTLAAYLIFVLRFKCITIDDLR